MSEQTQPERKHLCESAGFWFKAAREHQDAGLYKDAFLAMENAYNHVENALASAIHFTERELPPRKQGWDHSEQVLVLYAASPELQLTERYSIAYYHYKPPFDGPAWTDFSGTDQGRTPEKWWFLPVAPCDPGADLLRLLEADNPQSAVDNLRSILRRFKLAQASAGKHHEGDRAACQRLDDFQNEVWGSLDKYSKALGWGLTGIQPECWTLLDAAIEELVRWRGLRKER